MRFTVMVCCLGVACGLPSDLDLERNNPLDPGAVSVSPRCGNAKLNAGEDCDDGNGNDNDACTNACLRARCGDGITRQGLSAEEPGYESCDDANEVDTDACLASCQIARCGDGIVRLDRLAGEEGFEACDDGNSVDDDSCTNNC